MNNLRTIYFTDGASYKGSLLQNQTGWGLPSAFELEVRIFRFAFRETSIWWQKVIDLIPLAPLMLFATNVLLVKLSINTFCNFCIGTYDILYKFNSNKTQFSYSIEAFLLNLLNNSIFTSGTTAALCIIFLRSTDNCYLRKIIPF